MNHQPCSNYLANSTKMSRRVSLAGVALENFNVSLEDVILLNLSGDYPSTAELVNSHSELTLSTDHVLAAMSALEAQMDQLYFVDLPASRTFSYSVFAVACCARFETPLSEATLVSARYESGGFRAALAGMRSDLFAFICEVDAIGNKISAIAKKPDLNIALEFESNREGNIRREFARLYSSWRSFQIRFLLSSLISTEIYYRQECVGSLLEEYDTTSAV